MKKLFLLALILASCACEEKPVLNPDPAPEPDPDPEPEPALAVAFETLISIGLVFSFPIRIAGIVSFPSLFGIRLNTQVFSAFIRPFTTLF